VWPENIATFFFGERMPEKTTQIWVTKLEHFVGDSYFTIIQAGSPSCFDSGSFTRIH